MYTQHSDHAEALQQELRHVYWIGGGSAGGKSTLARHIAEQHGLQLYISDDLMLDHAQHSTPENSPALHAFMAMNMDERWLNRTPQAMYESFHWFQGECFNMIVDDLLRLPKQPAVIVEGLRLLPALVAPLLTARQQAVWLLATPTFRQAVFASRGGAQWAFLGKTSQPERALQNLLVRDALFTQQLAEETRQLGLHAISVDGTQTVDALSSRVMEAFRLA